MSDAPRFQNRLLAREQLGTTRGWATIGWAKLGRTVSNWARYGWMKLGWVIVGSAGFCWAGGGCAAVSESAEATHQKFAGTFSLSETDRQIVADKLLSMTMYEFLNLAAEVGWIPMDAETPAEREAATHRMLVAILEKPPNPGPLRLAALDFSKIEEEIQRAVVGEFIAPLLPKERRPAVKALCGKRNNLSRCAWSVLPYLAADKAARARFDRPEVLLRDVDPQEPRSSNQKFLYVDGRRGAYLHVVWMALLTNAVDGRWARKVGKINEDHQSGKRDELYEKRKDMDLHNNEVGIRYAKNHPRANENTIVNRLEDVVREATTVGNGLYPKILLYYPVVRNPNAPIRLVPSNTPYPREFGD